MRQIVKCNFCGYGWFTISLNIKVSCPKCGGKIRINEDVNSRKCAVCGKYRIITKLIEKEGKYYHKRCLGGKK